MKKLFKVFKVLLMVILGSIVILFVLNIIPVTFSKVKGDNPFRKDDYPLIIPHGGAKELVPENTVYAYDMLIDQYQVDVLEIDLVLTSDGILISHHDLDLDADPNGNHNDEMISNYTYAELLLAYAEDDYYKARNFVDPEGFKPFKDETDMSVMEAMVPAKLEDIFNKHNNDILYMLEIKDAPTSRGYEEGSNRFELATKELVRLVEDYSLENNVVLASFSDEVTKLFKATNENIIIGAATNEVTMFSILSAFHLDFFWKVKSEVLILPIPESMTMNKGLTKTLDLIPKTFRKSIALKEDGKYRANLTHTQIIKDAHRKNMAVIYWTVNDKETMRMLIENGADGIITDRPDFLIEVINEFKLKENNN